MHIRILRCLGWICLCGRIGWSKSDFNLPFGKLDYRKTLNIPHGILDSFWEEKPKWWWSKERKSNYQKRLDIFDTAKTRRGLLPDCLCLDCPQVQNFDLKKDEKKCRICSSLNVKPVRELLRSRRPQTSIQFKI